jgi:dihydrofolate reductase
MRKLILAMFMSLDGYIEGPDGEFVGPDWSADMQTYWSDAHMEMADLLIYGRKNFVFNSQFWQDAERDPDAPADLKAFAELMRSKPKLVVSSTLKEADWNARVAGPDLAAEINALKRQDGKAILSFGGADLARTLIELGLVDEYRILITPTLLAGGKRLFDGGYARQKLTLVDHRIMDTGAALLTLRPA